LSDIYFVLNIEVINERKYIKISVEDIIW